MNRRVHKPTLSADAGHLGRMILVSKGLLAQRDLLAWVIQSITHNRFEAWGLSFEPKIGVRSSS